MEVLTATKALVLLWQRNFFRDKEKSFSEIQEEISKLGSNPTSSNLQVALSRAKFLTRRGSKNNYSYIQKYPPQEIVLSTEVLPEKLVKQLGRPFEQDIKDLYHNYGVSGTCTAFL